MKKNAEEMFLESLKDHILHLAEFTIGDDQYQIVNDYSYGFVLDKYRFGVCEEGVSPEINRCTTIEELLDTSIMPDGKTLRQTLKNMDDKDFWFDGDEIYEDDET